MHSGLGNSFSLRELRNNAAEGCLDCGVLSEGVLLKCQGDWQRNARGQLWNHTQGGPIELQLYGPGLEQETLAFYVQSDESILNPKAPIGRHISSVASSEECLATAAGWLNTCVETHHCHTYDADKVPRRLLDLEFSKNRICLEEIVTNNKRHDYAALSYCWGNKVPVKLLSTNIVEMRRIKISELPAVFQDAISVARSLKIQYLWIDALCIIQDNSQDWELESARMGEIFSNATITIMAASADNCETSFLNNWETRAQKQSVQVFPTQDLSITPEVFVRSTELSNSTHATDRRGWILQERLLSRRLLRFERGEVNFQCRNGIEREGGNILGFNNLEDFTVGLGDDWFEHFEERPLTRLEDMSAVWYSLVSSASNRSLTYPRDIFPSLSGFAVEFHKKKGNVELYLAGMWKSSFVQDLQWRGEFQQAQFLEDYRAPSWSWASINGSIYYPRQTKHLSFLLQLSHLIDAQCTIKGRNVFGEVSDGFAVLEGPSLSMFLEGEQPFMELSDPESDANDFTPSLHSFIPDLAVEPVVLNDLTADGAKTARRCPKKPQSPNWSSCHVNVLCLSKLTRINADQDIMIQWQYLVLGRRMTTEESYQRLGLWLPGEAGEPFDGEKWLRNAQRKRFKIY